MIKVVIVSRTPKSEVALLDWLADIEASAVEPSTIDKTVQKISASNPDIIIIDQHLESFNADLLCHMLHQQIPTAQSMILTDEIPSFEMLKNTGFSVRGYITREQRSSLAKAVRVVHEGEAWLPRAIVTEMLDRFAKTISESNELQLQAVK